MRVARLLAGVGLGVAVISAGGCSRAASDAAVSGDGETLEATATADVSEGFRATEDPPVLSFAEFRLPRGAMISHYDSAMAAYDQNTFQEHPTRQLGLMVLADGERRLVVTEPVAGETYEAYEPVVGNGWLVWHEAEIPEGGAIDEIDWRLYAAPIDASQLAVGVASEVDRGHTSYASRPIYDFAGGELVWIRNRIPSDQQEGVERSCALVARDMSNGGVRTVYERRGRTIYTMKATADEIVFTEFWTAEGDDTHADVVAVRVSDGRELSRVEVSTGTGISHYAESVDGWTVWAAFRADDLPWPDLYARDPQGEVLCLANRALDPCCAGGYVFFECIGRNVSRTASEDSYEVWAADLVSRTKFLLIEDTEYFWQTCPVAPGEDVFVTYGVDFSGRERETVPVRVYRFDE